VLLVLLVLALDRPESFVHRFRNKVDPLVWPREVETLAFDGRNIAQMPDVLDDGRVNRAELEIVFDKGFETVALVLRAELAQRAPESLPSVRGFQNAPDVHSRSVPSRRIAR
jgi:hypothetical protein